MSNIVLESTSVDQVNTLLSSIDEERSIKKELLEKEVTFPATDADKLNVIKAFATSMWMEVKTNLYSNTKKDYAFIGKAWDTKSKASIWIWKDTNLGRLEITGSNKFVKLGYANTSSDTWFSKFNTIQD